MRSRAAIAVLVLLLLASPTASPADPPVGALDSDAVEVPIPANATIGLYDPSSVHWRTPVGLVGNERLEAVLVYSDEGHAVRFSVDDRALPEGGRGLEVLSTTHHAIPEGVELMIPHKFRGDKLLALGGGWLRVLDQGTLATEAEVVLDPAPRWYSNLWDRWSLMNGQGELLIAMANETSVSLYARIPPNPLYGEFNVREYLFTVHLDDYAETRGSRVVGEPLVVNHPDEENGSLVIVPTDRCVAALRLNYSVQHYYVEGVSLEGPVWTFPYTDITPDDILGGPIPDRPISFASEDPRVAYERVLLATDNGYVHSIHMDSGKLGWSLCIGRGTWFDFDIEGIWPDGRGNILAVANAGGDGLVAAIDPEVVRVLGNNSSYHVTPDRITMRPAYVASSRDYVLDTDDGTVYILDDGLGLAARFRLPGGLATDVGYVGNIVNNVGSSQGNYLAAVTGNATLWLQNIGGYYEPPPLPEPDGERVVFVTDAGNITVRLYANLTPRTSAFFLSLVENGTFDGVPVDFIAEEQWFSTGRPESEWWTIPNEGTALALPLDRGAVSMSIHGPGFTVPELVFTGGEWGYHEADGDLAVFAVVVDGWDVLDAILEAPTGTPEDPVIVREVVVPKAPGQDGGGGGEEEELLPCLVVGVLAVALVVAFALWPRRGR